ncbi:MAG: hypothetical protein WB755_22330, partial [Terriglobales bacterium]
MKFSRNEEPFRTSAPHNQDHECKRLFNSCDPRTAKIIGWRLQMADREHLHALVDSLPEGALESAQTYLKA